MTNDESYEERVARHVRGAAPLPRVDHLVDEHVGMIIAEQRRMRSTHDRRRSVGTRRRTRRVLLLACAALVALGIPTLALAGQLPDPLQRAAARVGDAIGVDVPAPRDSARIDQRDHRTPLVQGRSAGSDADWPQGTDPGPSTDRRLDTATPPTGGTNEEGSRGGEQSTDAGTSSGEGAPTRPVADGGSGSSNPAPPAPTPTGTGNGNGNAGSGNSNAGGNGSTHAGGNGNSNAGGNGNGNGNGNENAGAGNSNAGGNGNENAGAGNSNAGGNGNENAGAGNSNAGGNGNGNSGENGNAGSGNSNAGGNGSGNAGGNGNGNAGGSGNENSGAGNSNAGGNGNGNGNGNGKS